MRVSIAVLVAWSMPFVAAGQENTPRPQTPNTVQLPADAPRPPAKIADLSWLAGAWEGKGLGGSIEEVWSKPSAGTMVGYFRLVKDGKPVFYEIMTLLESEGSVEMRLKHLNPDMTGWEEKNAFVTFRLVRQDERGAYFEGLTFRRAGPDAIAKPSSRSGTGPQEPFAKSSSRIGG